ncbi:MAG: iron-sulfur cluster assembly accessory protein [Candidatus Acidiferrales bacterium]
MIQITELAQSKLKSILQGHPEYTCIRVGVRGGGCSGFNYDMSFGPGKEWPDDYEQAWDVFEFSGLKVYVDPISHTYLDGVTVDYKESLEESGFSFHNPNVKATCGCGQSFSV